VATWLKKSDVELRQSLVQRRFQFKALHSCFSIIYFAFVFGFGVSNPKSETNRKSVFRTREIFF